MTVGFYCLIRKSTYMYQPNFMRRLLFSLLLFLTFSEGKTQELHAVTGIVQDSFGKGISAVSVIVKNNSLKYTTATVTDSTGKFHFSKLPKGAGFIFEIRATGYDKENLTGYSVKEGETISLIIKLKESVNTLNDVVVIGYGSVKKAGVTGSVSSIKGSELTNQPVASFDRALVGKMAGVQVLQSNGSPGVSATFRIRGTGSITAGNDPLVVLDGVPLDRQSIAFESINNEDIESIEVLKDAAASAIYGSRGSNGVVLITTKKGEPGNAKLSYSNYTGVQRVTKQIPMMDAYQYAALSKDGHDNAYLDVTPGASASDPDNIRSQGFMRTPPELYPYLQGVKGLTNTNWQDEIFRDALTMNHTITASWGSPNVKYYLSGNYTNQEGIIINSNYKRYNGRFNIDAKSGKLRFGVNFSPSISTRKRISSDDTYSNSGIVASALQMSPTWSVYNADGSYNFQGNGYWRIGTDYQHNEILNPVAVANLTDDKLFNVNIIGKVFAEYEIIKDLNYNISLGGVYVSTKNDFYRPSTLPSLGAAFYTSPSNPTGRASSSYNYNWIIEQTANYKKQIKQHSINALVGFTAQRDYTNAYSATATNFPNDAVRTINGGQISSSTAAINEWSLESFLGRLQYDFANKYFLSASLRSDGSSRFGSNNKWGTFPSLSASWIVSKEEFLRSNKFLSTLKLRASYGLTGNFNIGNYEPISLLNNDNYILGSSQGVLSSGLITNNITNNNLGWEKTSMLNIGVDLGFLNQDLTAELNYYNSNTTDLLLNTPIPASTGFLTARQNVGKVNNSGLELTINYHKKIGAFNFQIGGNISANKNEVKSLGPNNTPIIQTAGTANTYFITQIGQPIGSYYLLNKQGIYASAGDLAKYPVFTGSSRVGDYRFEDVDGDGKLDVDKDRKIVGKYFPDYTFGFNTSIEFKGIDVEAALQGSQGFEIVNLQKRYISNMEGNFNGTSDGVNRWRSESEPGNGEFNRANRKSTGNNGRTSTFHVEDGSYLRLQNLTIGYRLPTKWCQLIGMKSARIYVTGQNLITWTKYTGYNPEVNLYGANNALTPGVDYGAYPLAKTYAAGVNINF